MEIWWLKERVDRESFDALIAKRLKLALWPGQPFEVNATPCGWPSNHLCIFLLSPAALVFGGGTRLDEKASF